MLGFWAIESFRLKAAMVLAPPLLPDARVDILAELALRMDPERCSVVLSWEGCGDVRSVLRGCNDMIFYTLLLLER